MNDLFLMNQQVGKIFSKMQGDVPDVNLKTFFKEKELERKRFCEMLQNESKKLETKVDNSIMLQRRNHLTELSIKKSLRYEKSSNLLRQVNNLMQFSIMKYNDLLMEMNLSLPLCKLLVKQRDCIQSSLFLVKREADAMGFA
ncbi:hypothetical protein [Thalassobellus citreus]|uniref:hypothetical protein n=1 Tax=Thalassobellus citreus TaxID=3367752 RepID=UPI00379F0799